MLGFLKWNDREPYEKAVMAGLAALFLLAGLYLLAIKPVLSAHKTASAQSAKALRDYEIVTRALPQLGQGNVAAYAPFTRNVLIHTARDASVKLSRIQPDENSITIWVDDVPTVDLYGLINTLIIQHGAEFTRASITANDAGLLSAQLSMKTSE